MLWCDRAFRWAARGQTAKVLMPTSPRMLCGSESKFSQIINILSDVITICIDHDKYSYFISFNASLHSKNIS